MQTLDYVVLVSYFLVLIAIGVYASRKIHRQVDFFLGGRSFGKLLQTFAAFGAAAAGVGMTAGSCAGALSEGPTRNSLVAALWDGSTGETARLPPSAISRMAVKASPRMKAEKAASADMVPTFGKIFSFDAKARETISTSGWTEPALAVEAAASY